MPPFNVNAFWIKPIVHTSKSHSNGSAWAFALFSLTNFYQFNITNAVRLCESKSDKREKKNTIPDSISRTRTERHTLTHHTLFFRLLLLLHKSFSFNWKKKTILILVQLNVFLSAHFEKMRKNYFHWRGMLI